MPFDGTKDFAGAPVAAKMMAVFSKDGHGWCKNIFWHGNPNAPIRACLLGAYNFAKWGSTLSFCGHSPLLQAVRVVETQMVSLQGFVRVQEFNDAPERTFDDIRKVVMALAEIERETVAMKASIVSFTFAKKSLTVDTF